MEPAKDDNALVDVLDVLLRDGAVVRADVIVSIADVPLVGIKLSAAIAGMETMNEYGIFEDWDAKRRSAASVARRQYTEEGSPRRLPGSPVTVGSEGRPNPRQVQRGAGRERSGGAGRERSGGASREQSRGASREQSRGASREQPEGASREQPEGTGRERSESSGTDAADRTRETATNGDDSDGRFDE